MDSEPTYALYRHDREESFERGQRTLSSLLHQTQLQFHAAQPRLQPLQVEKTRNRPRWALQRRARALSADICRQAMAPPEVSAGAAFSTGHVTR
jgi:hypothetical protein